MKSGNLVIYSLLFVILFLSSISPKAFKMMSGYEGVYPNPHLILIILLLPLFLYFRIFQFDKTIFLIIMLGVVLSGIYWISTMFAYISANLYEEGLFNPLIQSIKMTLTYLIFVPFFLLLKNNYIIVSTNIYFFLGVLHFLIFLYGELVFLI